MDFWHDAKHQTTTFFNVNIGNTYILWKLSNALDKGARLVNR